MMQECREGQEGEEEEKGGKDEDRKF